MTTVIGTASAGVRRAFAAVFCTFALISPAKAQVQYVYDELGRVVAVIAPNGESARYIYDAAGNIKQIQRSAAGTLTLAEFTPNLAAVGATVAIYGTGFSATPSNNVVRFNGTQATVSAATANKLTVTVPAAATSGPISITVGATTVTSTQSFTVGATGPVPTIAGFTPSSGSNGTVVTVNGTGFDTDAANNRLSLNGAAQALTLSTATQLRFAVSPLATSGKVQVTTLYGSATSSADLFIAPAGIAAADITRRGRLVVGGSAAVVSGLAPLKYGQYLFDGVVGQNLGLGFSGITYSPADGAGGFYVSLRLPNGSVWTTDCGTISGTSAACRLPPLPVSGTYQLFIQSASHTSTVNITLSNDVTAALTINAATPTTFASTRPGQNGRYTFNATAGEKYSVLPSDITIDGTWTTISALGPDGREVGSTNGAVGFEVNPFDFTAPITGVYTVFVDPYLANTGQAKVAVRRDATGTLAVNGASVSANLLAGQNGRYTFSGTAGQNLGLGVTALATTPPNGTVSFRVLDPTGQPLAGCAGLNGIQGNASCNLQRLPATGSYTVVVDPLATSAAAMTLTLSSDVSGVIAVNAGTPTTFSTTRPGQNGRYTFSAAANKKYSILPSGVTIDGTWTSVYVYSPDGTELANNFVGAGFDTVPVDFNAPITGTYSVLVDPFSANTGQVRLSVLTNSTGTLAINGASTAVSLAAGQNGSYTFSGTAGQKLGLGVTGISTSPPGSGVVVRIHGPTGQEIVACSAYGFYADGDCNLPSLPATGTYTVSVDPIGTNGAALTLTLSSDAAGTLTVNSTTPSTFSTARAGQNGRYTFSATAGGRYSVLFSAATINNSALYIYGPDGSQIGSASVATGADPVTIDFTALATGSHTVFIDPLQAQTGQMNLSLLREVAGSLTLNGTTTTVNLLPGQNGRYTFTGAVGQTLGLGVTGVSFTPAGGVMMLRLYSPTGQQLAACNPYGVTADADCNLPPLPAAGTYTVLIDPASGSAATFGLLLSADLTGVLTVNAATPTTFSTTRVGQNGRFSFSGSSGRRYSIVPSNPTGPDTPTTILLYSPSGALLGSTTAIGGSGAAPIDVANAPSTGTYTVFVDPPMGGVSSVGLQVLDNGAASVPPQTPNGSLTVGGAPLTITLPPWQTHLYTFSGTQGQRLGLGLTSLTPSNSNVHVSVYLPENSTLLTDCGWLVSNSDCNLAALPGSGSYTIRVQAPEASNATLTLSADLTATLTPNSVNPTTVSLSRDGQNVRATFSGTAGQYMSLAWGNSTLSTASYLYVLGPDGSPFAGGNLGTSSGVVDLPQLPATGTYSVLVDSAVPSAGQISLSLRTDASAALSVDGTPTAISLAAGQNGRFTFAGTVGQTLGLAISNMSITPSDPYAYVYIRLYDPSGNVLTDCGYGPVAWDCNFSKLRSTGTHTVVVDAPASSALTATLTLSTDSAAVLMPNAATPTTFTAARAGQNGRFTFSGTAGQYLGVAWSESTFDAAYIYVYAPDGSALSSGYVSTFDGKLELPVLSATGTYTIVVDPATGSTGQLKLALRSALTGTVAIDGSSTAFSLTPGQVGRFTFAGTTSQVLGVGVTNLALVPDNGTGVQILVYPPGGGSPIYQCNVAAGATCNPLKLQQAGTYTMVASAPSAASVAGSLTLSNDLTGVLAINASTPTLFSSSRPGQNGRYTFNATAGNHYSLTWTDLTLQSYANSLQVTSPGGALVQSTPLQAPRGLLDIGVATATGTYSVQVAPGAFELGAVKLGLTQVLRGALTVDAASPSAVSLVEGQQLLFDIAGLAGANLGVVFSNVVTSPDAASTNPLTVELISPAGEVLTHCSVGDAGSSTCRFPTLRSTGTFKVRIKPGTNAATFGLLLRSTI